MKITRSQLRKLIIEQIEGELKRIVPSDIRKALLDSGIEPHGAYTFYGTLRNGKRGFFVAVTKEEDEERAIGAVERLGYPVQNIPALETLGIKASRGGHRIKPLDPDFPALNDFTYGDAEGKGDNVHIPQEEILDDILEKSDVIIMIEY